MKVVARALRTVLVALGLTGLAVAGSGLPTPTTVAGTSGQPGDPDAG